MTSESIFHVCVKWVMRPIGICILEFIIIQMGWSWFDKRWHNKERIDQMINRSCTRWGFGEMWEYYCDRFAIVVGFKFCFNYFNDVFNLLKKIIGLTYLCLFFAYAFLVIFKCLRFNYFKITFSPISIMIYRSGPSSELDVFAHLSSSPFMRNSRTHDWPFSLSLY